MARLPEGYEVIDSGTDALGLWVTIRVDEDVYRRLVAGLDAPISAEFPHFDEEPISAVLPGPSPVQTDPRENDGDTAGLRTGTSRGLRAPRSDG